MAAVVILSTFILRSPLSMVSKCERGLYFKYPISSNYGTIDYIDYRGNFYGKQCVCSYLYRFSQCNGGLDFGSRYKKKPFLMNLLKKATFRLRRIAPTA